MIQSLEIGIGRIDLYIYVKVMHLASLVKVIGHELTYLDLMPNYFYNY